MSRCGFSFFHHIIIIIITTVSSFSKRGKSGLKESETFFSLV